MKTFNINLKNKKIMNKVNAFENEIFDHYRQKAMEINKAIELLKEHNYTVIDLEGNWINKTR